MQLSQFDKEATLDQDGRVTVAGPVALETDEDGKVIPRRSTVRFHFLIVQGDHVLQGESASNADRWTGTTLDANHGLTPGPATAMGHAVEVKEKPTPTFLSSTWVEEITLRPLG
jgi:hypothetical protein